ncbi:MAG: hypothetical protein ACI9GH_000212 [Candidatus Paceibacteria bacterium]|jgi:hypothetical protein
MSTEKLKINLNNFSFIERECSKNNKTKTNRCLRDFLYYALHFYYPKKFNNEELNAEKIEDQRLFGFKIKEGFPFGGGQYSKITPFLNENNLYLEVNNKKIRNLWDFILAFFFKNLSYKKLIIFINKNIENNIPIGIDVPAGLVMDHVMFVYKIDEKGIYLIDSHKAPNIPYTNISNESGKFVMFMNFKDLKRIWNWRGLVWVVKKSS